jgi:hypothetical protein
MATEKQILANQENSKLSTGPTSDAGIQASSQNNFRHGLAPRHHEVFTFMKDEEPAKFGELLTKLLKEHSPQSERRRKFSFAAWPNPSGYAPAPSVCKPIASRTTTT